jgi:hypothetical protein
MTTIAITGMGLTGHTRLTWVQDQLAHVLEHCETDEPSGTWTGLACPDYGLALGADVDNATLQHMAADGDVADLVWEVPDDITIEHGQLLKSAIQAHYATSSELAERLWQEVHEIWSQAWAANYGVLEFLQSTGLTKFSPVKPQRWVIASFEHHCGPHGFPRPHIHNVVLTNLTVKARVERE